MQSIADIEEAKAIMRRGLGKAELEFIASLTAPFAWVIRLPDHNYAAKNGSAFFLDTGSRLFGVTAAHVVSKWRSDLAKQKVVASFIGGRGTTLPIDPSRFIDIDDKIDIATFAITERQVASIGHTVLTGYQKAWPPGPPQVDRGLYYCGFPGNGRIWLSANEISFGAVPGSGVATSVSEVDISSLIEREHLMPALGHGIPPENFDFGGISGGPMLTVIETTIRSWALAGVIYQGPNPSTDEQEAIAGLEIIKARRAHFILPDGTLNRALWHALNPR